MFRFFPYWPLFVVLTVLAEIGAWSYMQIATPYYLINATLLIKDEKRGVQNSEIESNNILASKKIVENEIEVIKSRALIRETVSILQLSCPVYEEGLLVDYSAYTTSPVVVEAGDIFQIREADHISFSYDDKSKTVLFEGNEQPLNQWFISPYGEIRFIANKNLKDPGIGSFYVTFINPRKVIDELAKSLEVQPSNKLATIVNLVLKDSDPTRGENILNTLIDSYNLASINEKNLLAVNTLEFVEERIKNVERDLDSLERSIQQYKSARGIVDLSEQGKVFLKNVGDNDQRLSALDMQQAILDKLEDYVIHKDNSAKIVPSNLGITDEKLSGLIEKLYEAEVEYARLEKTTAENNPVLLSLKTKIESMRPSILENIRNQKSSLAASRAKLASTNNKYAQVLTTIPESERQLLEANRQQTIKNEAYTYLLQKREETALSTGATTADSRLVDRAEASVAPVAPRKMIVYGGALVFAIMLGAAWIAKKELLNSTVLFRNEIESVTNIPIAGEIVDSQMKSYVVIDNIKKPYLTDQFTQLRAAAALYTSSPSKVMMVTSSITGEGKSFICANYAISLAGSKQKVLLVDMDLRNPRISNLYNVTNGPGLAEFLSGDAPVEKVVRRTVTQNLYILSAGRRRIGATEKLLGPNVQELFKKLRAHFDYIVVDTPPITSVLDAHVISHHCDVTFFVIRHAKTPKGILKMIERSSKVQKLKNVFILFNGVRPRGMITNGYGYGYGYGYTYEYSDGSSNGRGG